MQANGSETGPRRLRKALPPRVNKAAVWGFAVGLPVLVAALWYFIEVPTPDPLSPTTWLAAGFWAVVGVVLLVMWGRARTKVQERRAELWLYWIIVAVLALAGSSIGLAGAANALAGGFWGLYVGTALFFVYTFSYRSRLLYCGVCRDYSWMTRIGRSFQCYYCQTFWTPDPAGVRGLIPSHPAPRATIPAQSVPLPPGGLPTVDVLERKRMKASVRVHVPTSPPHVVEATFQTAVSSSANVIVDGNPFQKVRVLVGAKRIDVPLSAHATLVFRFWLSRVPQIDIGFNGAFVKRV